MTIYTQTNPLRFRGEALYLIEGTLRELQTARTTVNLLEQIETNVKTKSVIAGAGAVLGGLQGMAASAASIAMYDGEEACHFAGLMDGRVLCGTFRHAENIKNGDRVKAVVSERGDALFVHAIMNAKTREFYMPINVVFGRDGLFSHCMRTAFGFTISGWIFFLIASLFMGLFSDPSMSADAKLVFALMLFAGPPLVMFPFEYWTYRTMLGKSSEAGASYGGAIFTVFGFSTPEKIDLTRHSALSMDTKGGWYAAWRVGRLM